MERCPWCLGSEIYQKYHDEEWGIPVHDEKKHFEFLILETAQAGLSWLTILKRREGYGKAFAGFDPEIVATFGKGRIEELMKDPSIIRNRRKITSAVNNAERFLAVQKEFGSFDSYIWSFVERRPKVNSWRTIDEIPARTELSERLSRDLRRRGFTFMGPTIIYAHLQATGLVNDHIVSCFRYKELKDII